MRRLLSLPVVAALATTGLCGPAHAAGGDRPDTIAAARQAPAAPTDRWLHERLSSPADRDVYRVRLRHAGRVLVTLGHLPADYVLTVYDRHGRRVARSDHAGRRFEQIYRHLDEGTWFVAVSGHDRVDPGTDYVLDIRPLPTGTFVVDRRAISGYDGIGVRGEVLDNAGHWVQVLHLHVVLLDRQGRRTGTRNVGIRPGPVAPHHRAEFEIDLPARDLPAGTTGCRISVASTRTDLRTPRGVVLHRDPVRTTPKQRLYSGTVTNTSSRTISEVWPTVVEYDNRGRAIAFGYAHIKSLAPGESRSYTAAVNVHDLPRVGGFREFAAVYSTT